MSVIKLLRELCNGWCCDYFLGKLVPVMTTVSAKNLFLMSSLNFPCQDFIPFACVLLLVNRERSAPASLHCAPLGSCGL